MFKLLIVVALFFYSPAVFAMSHLSTAVTGSPLVGKPAPDAVLPQSQGESLSVIGTRQGQKAILIFWATWCVNCYQELGDLNVNLSAIEQNGIKVILVDIGENKEAVNKYFNRRQMKLTSFIDGDSTLQDPYHLVGIPTLVFIDEKGIVRSVTHEFPADYQKYFGY